VYSDGVNAGNNASTADLRTTIRNPFISTFRSTGPGQVLGVTVNGTNQAVSQGSGMGTESGSTGYTVGTREDQPNLMPWSGDYAEVLVYNRALTAAEQTQVETYLSNKYGIPTSANPTPGSTAPTLTAVVPARNAASAAHSGDLSLTFSEAMSSASASATALKVFGSFSGLRPAAYSGGGSSTLSINPSADFRAGERVEVTVTTAAQSNAGSTALNRGYVSQFTAAAGAGTGTLAGSLDLGANRPVQVAAGDFNGDGANDLVAANYQGNIGISVWLSNGSGTFGSAANFGSGQMHSVVTGDVDGDGDLDVVGAQYNGSAAIIYLNNGSGSFTVSSVSVGGAPTDVDLGDVDGDGDLDLVSSNYSSNSVSVRLNNGAGVFSGSSNLGTGVTAIGSALADFDQDGDLDLAVSCYGSNVVYVYANNGSGSFGPTASASISTGSSPYWISAGDFDNDGFADLAIPNYGSSTVTMAWGSGTGSFVTTTLSTGFSNPSVTAAGDVDGDGRLDLAVGSYSAANVQLVRNLGSRSFGTPANVAVQAAAYHLTLADLNGDNALDLATANYGNGSGNTVSVRFNTSVGVPAITSFTPSSGTPGTVVTIIGSNLSGLSSLSFNGSAATTYSVNAAGTQATATVPAAATTGFIAVANASGTANTSALATPNFTVLPAPTISGFTPGSAAAGSPVSISGSNLTGVTGVLFGGVPAASFSAQSGSSLTATPAAAGASGLITLLYGSNGSVSSASSFILLLPNVTRVEYFLDADPGLGSASSVSLTAAADISSLSFGVNLASLTAGFHRLGVRSKDATGQWSLTTNQNFFYEPLANQSAGNVVRAEYFVDADPGLGLGTSIAIATPGTDVAGLAFNVDLSALTAGFHRLSVRSKDANGKWSLTSGQNFFYEPLANQAASNIVKAEYFLDSDPAWAWA
jgi:hypothetical protein